MKQIGFIASTDGQVVKYDASLHAPKPKPQPLTRHQRATLYFKAVRYISKLFREVGFEPVTLDSHTAFTLELGDFMLEMCVQQPPPMAHVTSFPGYVYSDKKINAKVTSATPAAPGEYVIRVIATLPNMRTCLPVYVVVGADAQSPMKEAFMSALAAAKELIEKDPNTMRRIQQALKERNIEKDFEKFNSEEDGHRLKE
jgi:hypothetical protein